MSRCSRFELRSHFSYGYFLYREEKSNSFALVDGSCGHRRPRHYERDILSSILARGRLRSLDLNYFRSSIPGFVCSKEPTVTDAKSEPALIVGSQITMVSVVIDSALCSPGFFLNMHGAVDMLTALQVWTHTGTSHTGHEKPFFNTGFELLSKYEWPCLIGLVGDAGRVLYEDRAKSRA